MRLFIALVLAGCCWHAGAASAGEVLAYTDLEPDILKQYQRELVKRFPGLNIMWVRESGGPITARLLAEGANPQADIIFGLALSGVLTVDAAGGLEPYTPPGLENVDPMMRDTREKPTWTGMNIVVGALAVNPRECERLGIPVPESWEDLTKPVYRGHIIMPHPVSSGTAYLHIVSFLQNMGEDKAWALMEALHKNVKMYVHSGSKPAQMAATGETPIGVSVDAYIATYVRKKAPVRAVFPKEGAGWDIVVAALVKNRPKTGLVKPLMDYAASRDAAQVGLDFDYLPVRSENDSERAADIRGRLMPMDLPRAAAERDAILKEWRRRFESTAVAAPK